MPSRSAPGQWEVFTHGGRRDTGIDAVAWCRQVASLGAGEILLTSMDRDGTGTGLRPRPAARGLCARCGCRSIASGGVGTLQHFVEGARAGATGLLAASVFHFGTFTIAQVKQALAEAGLPVRLSAAGRLTMAKTTKKKTTAAPGRRLSRRSRPESSASQELAWAVEGSRPPPAISSDAAVLDRLLVGGESRRDADPAISHSARLLSRGTAKVAQKFGEEAVECLIEAVAGNRDALVAESADVLYHLLVLWVSSGVAPDEVWAELMRREGISGIAEKAARARNLSGCAAGWARRKSPERGCRLAWRRTSS